MEKARYVRTFVKGTKKPSGIFFADHNRLGAGDPQKSMENSWLNIAAQKRTTASGTGAMIYAVAADEDGRNAIREYFSAEYLRRYAAMGILRNIAGRESVGFTLNDFNGLHCAPDSLQGLCGFSVRMDWRFTRRYQGSSQNMIKGKVLAMCQRQGLPIPTQMTETCRGLQAVWYLKQRKEANYLPVWNELQNELYKIFSAFGAVSARLGVCETVELPVGGKKLLYSKEQPTSWDAMYNGIRRAYYARAYSAIAAKHFPDPESRPEWYRVQQMVDDGALHVQAQEIPSPFISNAPSYYWLNSAGWDEETIVQAALPEQTKIKTWDSEAARRKNEELRVYYREVAEDLLKLAGLRKGNFSQEMQQRLLFYVYFYTVLYISGKRKGDALAVDAVRKANAMMRHPMAPEALELRITGLQKGVRHNRASVSRARVLSDLQITAKEEQQLKRLAGHDVKCRRKNKSGMLRPEKDAALNTAIAEMLAQGLLHREIAEKLGMSREAVTRRIKRCNLLHELQQARNDVKKEEAKAKKAQKEKKKAEKENKDKGNGSGGMCAASRMQKVEGKARTGRKPVSEARRLAVLAIQRVRRGKERLARKCSTCLRNLAKQCHTLDTAPVEWIGTAAEVGYRGVAMPKLC